MHYILCIKARHDNIQYVSMGKVASEFLYTTASERIKNQMHGRRHIRGNFLGGKKTWGNIVLKPQKRLGLFDACIITSCTALMNSCVV